MASLPLSSIPLLFLLLIPTITADPDALQDFCVADTKSSTTFFNGLPCLNPSEVTGKHFTTSVLNKPANTSGNPFLYGVTITSPQALPGINTMGIALARVDVEKGGQVPAHTHPRADEYVCIMEGTFNGGFVDSNNNYYSQTVKAGDVFVFPRGTIHFLQNIHDGHGYMLAGFNSQNPGLAVTPLQTFASNPAVPPLAQAFQISEKDVRKIRKKLGGSGG
ncbi:hypothetical protein SUGI_0014230 [Cryptomeria japonica]|uniref:germin-like protein subfamily 1 member 1 n=1 Tax=Cryptomeria japonica TaxID=3369 RepID=UPI002408F074|nr:germin-like protein subfamily 1 member 1 [Cryptomeria japonica]GLJ05226.1 hypothetical protein SUGI_0014230 [Cryptomeria japonica]